MNVRASSKLIRMYVICVICAQIRGWLLKKSTHWQLIANHSSNIATWVQVHSDV